jgi:hypothetical protein
MISNFSSGVVVDSTYFSVISCHSAHPPISSAMGAPEPPRTWIAPLLASTGRISSTLRRMSQAGRAHYHGPRNYLRVFRVAIDLRGHKGTRTAGQENAQGEREYSHLLRENESLPDASSVTPSRCSNGKPTELRCIMSTHARFWETIYVVRLYAPRREKI